MWRLRFLKARLLIYTWLSKLLAKLCFVDFPPLVAVCAFIEDEDGRLLSLDHSYAPGFGLVGGRVDAGETLEEALIREVEEEAGLQVTSLEYLFSTEGQQYGLPSVLACYTVRTTGEVVKSAEGDVAYRALDNLMGNMTYANLEFALKKYRQIRNSAAGKPPSNDRA